MEWLEPLNYTLFLFINAGSDPWMVGVYGAIFMAQWLVFSLPLLLLGMWLWGTSRVREAAVKAALTVVLGLAVVLMIRTVWPHPRPFVVGLGFAYLSHAPDASFPSNHAVFCFSMGFSLFWDSLPKIGRLVFWVGLLISWARVYLGVHFPLDMVGSLLVAWLAVMAVHRLFRVRRLGDRLVVWLEDMHRHLLAVPISKGWIAE